MPNMSNTPDTSNNQDSSTDTKDSPNSSPNESPSESNSSPNSSLGAGVYIFAGLLVLALVVVGYFFSFGKQDSSSNTATEQSSDNVTIQEKGMAQVNELNITDTVVGTGTEVSNGMKVTVHYKGMLDDGTEFDSSYNRNQPFSFVLGSGSVIAGWDQGILGMKVGGERTLVIPPELGYGSQATGPIPANSTLTFEVKLLEATASQ